MIRVIHNKCGKTAFYFKKRLYTGDLVNAENIVLLNGQHPEPATLIKCESCHEAIGGLTSDVVTQQHWTDWFIKRKDTP